MIVSLTGSSTDHDDAVLVLTPLEAIVRLEKRPIRTVVLAGSYARDRELAQFLGEEYPSVRVERVR